MIEEEKVQIKERERADNAFSIENRLSIDAFLH